MKFSLAASTLGLAALALAAPADLEARTGGGRDGGGGGGGGGGQNQACGSNQQAVCCQGSSCFVNQGKKNGAGLTVNCGDQDATVKCCQTNSSPGSLINIQALNCVDAGDIDIPLDLGDLGILS